MTRNRTSSGGAFRYELWMMAASPSSCRRALIAARSSNLAWSISATKQEIAKAFLLARVVPGLYVAGDQPAPSLFVHRLWVVRSRVNAAQVRTCRLGVVDVVPGAANVET